MKTLILVGRTARAAFTGMALLAATQTASAQSAPTAPPVLAPYRHRILGVYGSDTGAPLESVTITDILSGTKINTTSTGTATLAFLPDGGSFIRITKLGYETQTLLAAISPKDTAPLTVILVHSVATTLAPVVITDSAPHYISPALNGFEERRKLGFGHFITEADLRKNDSRQFSDVLERIPGIRMVTFANHIYIASMRDQKDARVPSFQQFKTTGKFSSNGDPVLTVQGCWVTVYIDGSVIYDPGSANPLTNPPDVSQLNINQFAGIEYYEGGATMPAQFNSTGNSCGTLLLWTRER